MPLRLLATSLRSIDDVKVEREQWFVCDLRPVSSKVDPVARVEGVIDTDGCSIGRINLI
jgi:hypothetical protein